MATSGIYQIKNIKTGKIYIGSSIDIWGRRDSHFRELRKGTHDNYKLQNAFNKYKEEAFKFKILKVIDKPNKYKLITWEQFFMDMFKSYDRVIGYNLCKRADSALGRPRRKESINKMKATMEKQERHLTQEQKNHLSKIFKGRPNPNVSKALLDDRDLKGKTYKVIDPNGNIITIQNLSYFCEMSHDLSKQSFRLFLGGRGKSYKGYKRIDYASK